MKLSGMAPRSGRTFNEDGKIVNIADELYGGKARKAESITPSDVDDIDVTEGLYLGTSGDVKITLTDMEDGTSVVLKGLQEGVIHPLRIKRIWNTDTTAEDIIAIY